MARKVSVAMLCRIYWGRGQPVRRFAMELALNWVLVVTYRLRD